MAGYKLSAIRRQTLREVLSFRPVGKARIVIRREKTAGHSTAVTSEIRIEALLGWPEFRGRPEMPFSSEACFVSSLSECFSEGFLIEIHSVMKGSGQESATSSPREKVRRVRSGGMTTCHDGIPRRRADWVGGITIGEAASRRCDAVTIWCLVEGVRIIGANVHIPQIVYQKEDHIRALWTCRERE